MIYFDTAYIVKCYVYEPGSSEVRRALTDQRSVACCALGRVEFAAAVKRAIRERRLDARVRDTVFSVLERDDENGIWTWLPLTSDLIKIAAAEARSLPDD